MCSTGIAAGKMEFSLALKRNLQAGSPCRGRCIGKQTANAARSHMPNNGFTLLELLIVLVILVSILAIAWPQMRKRMARNQIKQVAIDLVEEIAEARRLAIQKGETFVLQFGESSSRYKIGPISELPEAKESGRQPIETIQIGVGDSASDSRTNEQSRTTVTIDLDPSIRIRLQDPVQGNESELASSDFETIEIGSSGDRDFDPSLHRIQFTPDGRADDVEFFICDRSNRIGISLRIRALTGQAEIGEPFKLEFPAEPENGNANQSPEDDPELVLESS